MKETVRAYNKTQGGLSFSLLSARTVRRTTDRNLVLGRSATGRIIGPFFIAATDVRAASPTTTDLS